MLQVSIIYCLSVNHAGGKSGKKTIGKKNLPLHIKKPSDRSMYRSITSEHMSRGKAVSTGSQLSLPVPEPVPDSVAQSRPFQTRLLIVELLRSVHVCSGLTDREVLGSIPHVVHSLPVVLQEQEALSPTCSSVTGAWWDRL